MPCSFTYPSIEEAARGLLVLTRTILAESSHHVVIGGWSPYLLNAAPIPHPGTRDVDLLFPGGATRGHLREVFSLLLDAGFAPSAKHEFQALISLSVAEQDFLFNVDLLHPLEDAVAESPTHDDLFVDHLELAAPERNALPMRFLMKSIAAPNSDFILDTRRWVTHAVRGHLPDGTFTEVSVPLVDELGLIVSKVASVKSPKRPRDAFDIYLAIQQARDYGALVESANHLREADEGSFLSLTALRPVAASSDFTRRVSSYIDPSVGAEGDLGEPVLRFLDDIGLEADRHLT